MDNTLLSFSLNNTFENHSTPGNIKWILLVKPLTFPTPFSYTMDMSKAIFEVPSVRIKEKFPTHAYGWISEKHAIRSLVFVLNQRYTMKDVSTHMPKTPSVKDVLVRSGARLVADDNDNIALLWSVNGDFWVRIQTVTLSNGRVILAIYGDQGDTTLKHGPEMDASLNV